MDMDVNAMMTVIPRISSPALTAQDVYKRQTGSSMNRLLLVVLALLLAALGWQTWRLADASQTISTQSDDCLLYTSVICNINIVVEEVEDSVWGTLVKE